MPKILVLGAGLVGAEIARCLSEVDDVEVTVVDRSSNALHAVSVLSNRRVKPISCDFLRDSYDIKRLASLSDVVIGAIEPSIAYRVLAKVAEAGTPIVDISFYGESPLALDPVAKKHNIPIVVDCGVAPGLSNMLLGRELQDKRVESFICQCGGLPAKPESPWHYKAPLSPRSVIDLYTRKAVVMVEGKRVEFDPLETEEEVRLPEYPQLGTLVGIMSDGLRTLLDTTSVPNMADQTLRYPAHIRIMKEFLKSRFLSEGSVSVQDCDGNLVADGTLVESITRAEADCFTRRFSEAEFDVLTFSPQCSTSRYGQWLNDKDWPRIADAKRGKTFELVDQLWRELMRRDNRVGLNTRKEVHGIQSLARIGEQGGSKIWKLAGLDRKTSGLGMTAIACQAFFLTD